MKLSEEGRKKLYESNLKFNEGNRIKLAKEFTDEEMLFWLEQNENITVIGSEVGSGKTTMIFEFFCPVANLVEKEVLFLYPRKTIGDSLENYRQLHGFSNYTLKTYQNIENQFNIKLKEFNGHFEKAIQSVALELNERFDVIVADESDYFISDATFNSSTHISAKILNEFSKLDNNKLIFMTGTLEGLLQTEELWNKPFNIVSYPNREKLNVDRIIITDDIDISNEIENEFLLADSENQVWEFVNDKKIIKQLVDESNENDIDSIGMWSSREKTSAIETYPKTDSNEFFNQLITNNHDYRRLASTSVISSGVSILGNVNRIVKMSGSNTWQQVQQSVARFRKNNEDEKQSVTLLINAPRRQQIKKQLLSVEEDLKIFNKDFSFIDWQSDNRTLTAIPYGKYLSAPADNKIDSIEDVIQNNLFVKSALELRAKELYELLAYNGTIKESYENKLKKLYPKAKIEVIGRTKVEKLEDKLNRQPFFEYVLSKVGQTLFDDQQKELSEKGTGLGYNTGNKISLSKINQMLSDNMIPVEIKSKRKIIQSKRMTVWEIKEK